MNNPDWLTSELDRAEREVQSWDEWKREAMRREATAVSHARESDNGATSNTTHKLS